MISCTEFIPSYSELFRYLEEIWGKDEVLRYWDHLFAPKEDGIPLINFVKKEGIRGCYSYWSGTLSEEAADFTMMLNEKAGWFKNVMYRCPSKGRLLEFKDEIGLTPYPDYCLHCDYYRKALEQVGLQYLFNFDGVDEASCSLYVFDPKVFDGRIIVDENTVILSKKASENEYFHRDFHSSMNTGVDYLGEVHGEEHVVEYLKRFVKNVYVREIAAIKEMGLDAIEAKILDTYEKEKAPDAVSIVRDGDTMTVKVAYCPAVKHLNETGRTVSPWYRYTTEVVMGELAAVGGMMFTMNAYDEATGAATYTFACV